jgi:hypothetical protein
MQLVRKRKDYVVVRHRQKPSQLVLQPPAGMDGLAARAVPVAAAQRNTFALAAVRAFIDRVAERAGSANSYAPENAFFARRQMRVRHQKAGKESAQHGTDVLPALAAAGGKPLAHQSHGLSRKRGGFVAKPFKAVARR